MRCDESSRPVQLRRATGFDDDGQWRAPSRQRRQAPRAVGRPAELPPPAPAVENRAPLAFPE